MITESWNLQTGDNNSYDERIKISRPECTSYYFDHQVAILVLTIFSDQQKHSNSNQINSGNWRKKFVLSNRKWTDISVLLIKIIILLTIYQNSSEFVCFENYSTLNELPIKLNSVDFRRTYLCLMRNEYLSHLMK